MTDYMQLGVFLERIKPKPTWMDFVKRSVLVDEDDTLKADSFAVGDPARKRCALSSQVRLLI